MDVTIYPDPNPAIGAALVSSGMRRACEHSANIAMLLYQAQVAKRSGDLALSAHVHTEIAEVFKGDPRWVGVLTVGGRGVDYGAAHEFGIGDHPRSVVNLDGRQRVDEAANDLNIVLQQLGSA